MDVKLKKAWKNHPAGTVITSVSSGVMKDLKALGVLDTGRKWRGKVSKKVSEKVIDEAVKSTISPVNKMISESPKEKEEGEAKSPSTSKEKVDVKNHFQKKT